MICKEQDKTYLAKQAERNHKVFTESNAEFIIKPLDKIAYYVPGIFI